MELFAGSVGSTARRASDSGARGQRVKKGTPDDAGPSVGRHWRTIAPTGRTREPVRQSRAMDPLRRASRHARSRLAVLAIVRDSSAAACGSSSATATPTLRPRRPARRQTRRRRPPTPRSGDASTPTIEDQVAADPRPRGEDAGRRRPCSTRPGSSRTSRDQFDKDNPAERRRRHRAAAQALGPPPGRTPRCDDLYVELLGSQVAGFYDPDDEGALRRVASRRRSGRPRRSTFAHEFTTPSRTRTSTCRTLGLDAIGQGDRALARLSLVEGDATLAHDPLGAARNLTPAGAARAGRRVASTPSRSQHPRRDAADPPRVAAVPVHAGAPIVHERLQASGGWEAVDRACTTKPPASTEQVLHPEKYDAGEAPVEVDAARRTSPRGWAPAGRSTLEDTLGEFQLEIWLRGRPAVAKATGERRPRRAGAATGSLLVTNGPDGPRAVI